METYLVLASITFISMMSPGPDMVLIMKHSSNESRLMPMSCILGICTGVAIHISFSIMGIAAIIATSSQIYFWMKLVGASYLIFLGIKALLSKESSSKALNTGHSSQKGILEPFKEGLLCNVLNPKVTVFILAVFTQVIQPGTPLIDRISYGLFIVLEAVIVWNLFLSTIRLGPIQKFFRNSQKMIDRITGTALICFGTILGLKE